MSIRKIKVISKEESEIWFTDSELRYFEMIEFEPFDEIHLIEIPESMLVLMLHHIQGKMKQWDELNNQTVIQLIYFTDFLGYDVMYQEACHEVTIRILKCNDLIDIKQVIGIKTNITQKQALSVT